MTERKNDRPRRRASRRAKSVRARWVAAAGAGLALVVAAVIVLNVVTTSGGDPAEAAPTPSSTPSTPPFAELPDSDAFDGWLEADPSPSTSFRAVEVDAERGFSLQIASGEARGDAGPSLVQTGYLPQAGSYEISFSAKSAGSDATGVTVTAGNPIDMMAAAGMRSGTSDIEVPATGDEWQRISLSYTTPPGDLRFGMRIHVPGAGAVSLDDFTVISNGGESVWPANPDMQVNSATLAVTNRTLLLTREAPFVDLASRLFEGGTVQWELSRVADGRLVQNDQVELSSHVGRIDLMDLEYGVYALSLRGSVGGHEVQANTQLAVARQGDPRPAEDMSFGVHLHYSGGPSRTASLIDSFASLGIGSVRADVPWWLSEPSVGTYEYDSEIEAAMAQYAELGISAMHVPGYSNRNYDGGRTPSTPEGLAAYAAYSGNILQTFPDIPADVEVYNEYNHLGNSECGQTADCYLDMLKSTYSEIKSVDPDVQVVAPGNSGMGFQFDWMERFIELGGLDYTDVASAHPYVQPEGPEVLDADLSRFVAMVHEQSADMPIWITEMGWATVPDWVTEQQQADYTVRFAALAFARGVDKVLWYEAADTGASVGDIESNFGLMRTSNVLLPAASAPKPAAVALATYEAVVGPLKFSAEESLADGVHSVVFGDGAAAVRIAWSTVGPTEVALAGTGPIEVIGIDGVAKTLDDESGAVLTLTDSPVFISGDIDGVQTAQ